MRKFASWMIVFGMATTSAFAQQATPPQEKPPQVAPSPAPIEAPKPPANDAPKEAKPVEEKPLSRDEIYDKDIADAIRKLQSDSYIESEEAKQSLLEIGSRSIPALINELEKGKTENRYLACEILGNLRNGSAVTPLLKILVDKDVFGVSIASAAARSLGKIGDGRAIPDLIKVLDSDIVKIDVDLRCEAVKALGNLRALESVDTLKKFLSDKAIASNKQTILCAVVEALGKIRAKNVTEDIAKLLGDKQVEEWSGKTVEMYAAKALGKITGIDNGPIWEQTDKKTIESLEKWNKWRQDEAKKKEQASKKEEAPKTPEKKDTPQPNPPAVEKK